MPTGFLSMFLDNYLSEGRWRIAVSTLNRSIVLEVKEPESDLEGGLSVQQLSISNVPTYTPLDDQVVKVSGTLTVSF